MSAPLTSALSSRVNIVQASVRARAASGSNRVARSSKPIVVAKATPAESSNVVVLGGTGGTGSECVVQALKRGAKVTVLARDPSKMTTPPGTGGAAEGTPLSDPNLTVVKGNVSDAADVAKVITKDTTGIVVSLGGKTKDVGATMLTDGTTNVINAMKAAGVDKDGECFFSSLSRYFFLRMGNVIDGVCFVNSENRNRDVNRSRRLRQPGAHRLPHPHVHRHAIHLQRQEQPGAALLGSGRAGPGPRVLCGQAGWARARAAHRRRQRHRRRRYAHADSLIPIITVTVRIPTFLFQHSTRALTLFAHPVSSITAGSIARADVADFCLGALFEESFPYVGKAPCISSVGGTSWTKDRGDKGMMEA